MELRVDTDSTCFLCLQRPQFEVSSHFVKGTNGSEISKKVGLNGLCRHLGMDVKSILLKFIEREGLSLDLTRSKGNISVTLCATCAHVTEQLTEWAGVVEYASMMANEITKRLAGTLGVSRQSVKKENVQFGEQLRQMITIKCMEKVEKIKETSYPRIVLERVTLNESLRPKAECNPDPEEIISKFSTKELDAGSRDGNNGLSSVNTNQDIADASSAFSRTKLIQGTKPYFKELPPGIRFRCLKCRKVVPSSSARHNHLLAHHPETLFMDKQLSSTTDEEFSNCCKHVFRTKVLEGTPNKELRTKRGSNLSLNCTFCKEEFCHAQHLRYHLITEHYEAFAKEINDVQTSNSKMNFIREQAIENVIYTPDKQRMEIIFKSLYKLNKGPKVHFRCFQCRKTFPGEKIKIHVINNHLNKLFTKLKLEGVTNEQFSSCCKKVLALEAGKSEPARVAGKKKFKCQLCPQVLCHQIHLRRHLVLKHFDKLEQEIIGMQKSEDFEKRIIAEDLPLKL